MADPLVQEDLLEQSLSSGEHFTSIAHTTVDNSDFVFAGTNGGNLYQVRQSSGFNFKPRPILVCLLSSTNFNTKLSIV